MPSLSEIRSNPPAARAEVVHEVCLDGALVARMAALQNDLADLTSRITESTPTARIRSEVVRLRDAIAALGPEIEAASGKLTVRAAKSGGDWRRFVDANPPRGEGEPGHDRDQRVGRGVVNADALLDSLGDYAAEWDGEPMAPGDWDALSPAMHPGDLLSLAATVVTMYEAASDFTMRRSALSATLPGLSDFAELVTSESATSDSTGGSPSESSEVTTGTAGE